MSNETDKSISKAVEVLEVLNPKDSIAEHEKWVEKGLAKLKKQFDEDDDLTVTEKVKLLDTVKKHITEKRFSYDRIVEAFKNLPEDKVPLLKSYLKTAGFLEEQKRTTKESLF